MKRPGPMSMIQLGCIAVEILSAVACVFLGEFGWAVAALVAAAVLVPMTLYRYDM